MKFVYRCELQLNDEYIMRIFVSYARVDKPYCVQLVEVLDFHDLWYDQRLYAGQKWWKEILSRLEWCEGFLYLISQASLASDYCQREFEIAHSLGKHIFPVLIEPDLVLPDTINHLQYVDLSLGFTTQSIRDLMGAIYIAEQLDWKQTAEKQTIDTVSILDSNNTPTHFISEAAQAMERGDYDRAVMLLNHVLASKERPRFIDIEKLIAEAEAMLESQMIRRQMEREYLQIVELIHLPATRKIGVEAFQAFHKDHPDYDPENLAGVVHQPKIKPEKKLLQIAQERVRRIPLLEWCEIPAGNVRVSGSDRDKNNHVDAFLMARYPVTNKQYRAFINAANGYSNPKWWQYADDAFAWFQNNGQPRPPKYEGLDRPRETVTWYEARAFCLWLGNLTQLEIRLPTLQQRQRAIAGDDERIFPWGNTFDQNRCNTRENGLRMTTVVNRYPAGVSPYGVYDLAGNVWEWCLDRLASEEATEDGQMVEKAIVHGGAWVSPYNRCHIATNYALPLSTSFASIGFRLICTGYYP